MGSTTSIPPSPASYAIAVTSWLATLSASVAPPAHAFEWIPPGSQAKLSAGAGQVHSGSAAVFYNPANLIYSKFITGYGDASYLTGSLTYDPLDRSYEDTSTLVGQIGYEFGIVSQPWDWLALGFHYYPRGPMTVTQDELPYAPTRLAPIELVSFQKVDKGQGLGFGAAVQLGWDMTLGLSMQSITDAHQVYVTSFETGAPLVDAVWTGTYTHLCLGLRSEFADRQVAFTFSYRTSAEAPIAGEVLSVYRRITDYIVLGGTGFRPDGIGLGVQGRIGELTLHTDILFEGYAEGRDLVKTGWTDDDISTDYRNTFNLGGGIAYVYDTINIFSLAVANYPRALGPGSRSGEIWEHLRGANYGDWEGLTAQVFALGYRLRFRRDGYFHVGGSRMSGAMMGSDSSTAPGVMKVGTTSISMGIAYGI